MKNRENKNYDKKKFIFNILILVYTFMLLKLVLFKDVPLLSIHKIFSDGFKGFWGFNLVPFNSIMNMANNSSIGETQVITNIAANILIFIPLGIIIKTKYENLSLLKVMIFSGIISMSLEIVQFLLKIGISDIDDILLNSLGGLLGGILVNVRKRRMKISSNILLIATILFLSFSLFFYNKIGFTNDEISIITENEHLLADYKKDTEDYFGKIISINNNEIEIELELSKEEANFLGETTVKKVMVSDNTNLILGTIALTKGELGHDELRTTYKVITVSEINELVKQQDILPIRVWTNDSSNENNEVIDANQVLITLNE